MDSFILGKDLTFNCYILTKFTLSFEFLCFNSARLFAWIQSTWYIEKGNTNLTDSQYTHFIVNNMIYYANGLGIEIKEIKNKEKVKSE